MAGAFRIAEGYVEVTADESSYDRAMERLRGDKHTVKVGVDLDDKDAIAKLDKLVRDRVTKITASAETRIAADELKNLVQRRSVKIGTSVDTRVAADEISLLTRSRMVRVEVDFDGSALAGLSTLPRTVDVLAEINQAALDRAEAKLDKLTADRTVIIRASADTRVAADEIRNLTQRRKVRIGVDVDTRVAADSLANLTRRRTMTVQARADTDDAANSLRFLTRDRNVNVRARMIGGLAGLAGLNSSAGGVGILSSRLAMLASAAIGALPTLASLGQSLAAMGPAAAVAAPAVLSLATAFAAIKVGTSGIGDAFKAAFAPAVSSGAAAESATRRVEAAQRSLAKAQQGVKDAERAAAEARVEAARRVADAQRVLADAEQNAAEDRARAARNVADAQQELRNTLQSVADANRRAADAVANAERDLADAQRDARQAQEDLTEARKDAAMELEDLNNRLVDAGLDQRQKVLDLQDAEQDLAKVRAKGAAATQEEIDKAQLQYERAVQSLKEQQTETARLREEAAAANTAGVEGSERVEQAKARVSDANVSAADKVKALRDAELEASRTQEDGAQQAAKAQRDLSDARAVAAKATVDGARQIADAQRDVTDAQDAARKATVDGARQIQDAQQAAAGAARALADAQTSGSAAANKLGDAMAKLSPNAREFVNAVIAQGAAWRGLKLDVQDALFRGLGQTFVSLSTAVIPPLRAGLVGMADNLNAMAKNAAGAVIELSKTGQLRQMFDGLNAGFANLNRIPGQFITGLTRLSIAAAPAFQRITAAAGSAADRISKRISEGLASGSLEQSINGAIDIAKQFGELLGDVFGTLGNIMKAASAGGGDALGALGSVFAELRRITAMPEVQNALTSIFTAINAIAKLFATTLGAVIQAVLPLLAALAPTITALANALGPVLGQLAAALGSALMPVIEALLPVVGMIGDALIGVARAIMPLLGPIGQLLGAIVTALAPVMQVIVDIVVMLVSALATALMPVIQALIPVVQMIGQLLGALAPIFPQVISALTPLLLPIGQLITSLLRLAMEVLTPLMPLITGLAQLLAGVLAGALGILVPVVTTVIGWITKLVDAVTVAVEWIVVAVEWIVDKFKWLYDVLVGRGIIPDLVRGIGRWLTVLWTNTKKIFTVLKNWVVNTWNSLWSTIRTKWDSFWGGFRNAISNMKTSVVNWASGLKAAVTNVWSGLWNGVRDKATSIFKTIRDRITSFGAGMRNAFSALRNALGRIWDGVKSAIAAPIRFVVGTVYNNGIRRMWNTIAGKISSSITLPTIKLGFNKGGVVPGTGNRDTVPAMLTPGERILSTQQVTALGGHRGIDAMLGKDRPTQTGGQPTSQQERRRHQATQGFAEGGIVGSVTRAIGGAASSAASWAKDLVVGGLKAAAQKALSSLVRPLINKIPRSGIGNLMRGLSNKAIDGMMGWFTREDKKAVGGPAVQKALSWAKTQHGLPYQWAGNGNPSWDCATPSCVITTPRGPRKLADIYPGDTVTAFQDGKLVSSRVLAKWCTGEQEIYKVRTRNRELRVTAGHRVLAAVQQSSIPGVKPTIFDAWTTEWKHVRDLTRDDFLVTYTGHETGDGEEYPTDLAWLLGLWVADGSVQAGGGLRFCVYGDLADKVQEVWRRYYPDRKATHSARHGVMISHKGFVDWMMETGFRGKSHERAVPPIVGTWNRAAQDAFLEGYADGDGCYRGSGRKKVGDFHLATEIVYTATSQELMEGIRAMHIQRGDRATVLRPHNRGSKPIIIGGAEVKNARPVYRFEVAPGKGADQGTGAGHRPGLLQLVEQLKAENMSVQRVLSVEPDGTEETWDIEVEGSHSFVSDGLISHNCSGLTSAIESVIRGERPHRRWATGSFVGNNGPSGWVRNLNSPYMIGITNSGVGHTAGTIGGVNVESRGGDGVVIGKRARSYKDSMFTSRWGFAPAAKFDSGGLLQPGATMAVNATGRPERILDPQQTAMFEQLVRTGGGVTIENITVSGTFDFSSPSSRKAAATAMVAEMKEALRNYDRGRAR